MFVFRAQRRLSYLSDDDEATDITFKSPGIKRTTITPQKRKFETVSKKKKSVPLRKRRNRLVIDDEEESQDEDSSPPPPLKSIQKTTENQKQ